MFVDIIIAVVLGIVEGLTEFLPVSSTGHLIVTGYLLSYSGEKAATFEIVIQLGAILSVVWLYRERFMGLLKPNPEKKFSGWYGVMLLVVTSIPASILGLLTHKQIKQYLFNPGTVAWALAVGAFLILLLEWKKPRPDTDTLDQMTLKKALGIGMFQCLALWPGFSRSASTILGGMVCKLERTCAAEYSFIAAVPLMFAATLFDLWQNVHLFELRDTIMLCVGFSVSFVSALIAVKSFIYLLGRITLRPFAYYRLVIAPLILLFWT